MRTILKLMLFISIIVSLNGCNNKPHFTINGQIGGKENEKIYLAKYVNGDFLLTDSAVVNNGKFRFDGNQATPEFFFILNGKKTQSVQFFLENAEIIVTGHLDSISFAKVAGSPSQDEYMNFNDGLNKIAVGLLLDFWASWCFPCRRENPNLVAMYKRFHEKGFDIISVSLDENREEWLGAVKQDNLMWPQISDLKGGKNEAAELYGVDLIPDNFLLDKDGRILARRLMGESLKRKLEELLGE